MATDFDYVQGEILDIKERLNQLEEATDRYQGRCRREIKRPVICPVCGSEDCAKGRQ